MAKTPAALAFLDPPYNSGLALPALSGLRDKGWIEKGSVCVAEVAAREALEPLKGFDVMDERTYGAARLGFLKTT